MDIVWKCMDSQRGTLYMSCLQAWLHPGPYLRLLGYPPTCWFCISVLVFISSRLLGSSTCTRTVWKVSSPKPFWLCWQQLDFFWIAPTYPTILAAPGEIISFPSGPHHMSQGWCLLDLISLASVSGPLWAQGEERRGTVALLARPRSFD